MPKSEQVMDDIRKSHRFFKEVGPSNSDYINDNLLIDMMLKEETHIYVGGAGHSPIRSLTRPVEIHRWCDVRSRVRCDTRR